MAAILHQNILHVSVEVERKRTIFNQLNWGMNRWQVESAGTLENPLLFVMSVMYYV